LELLDQKELAAVIDSAATAFCFSNGQHNTAIYDRIRDEVRLTLPKAYLTWQKLQKV